jgi:hypothetical protein
MWISRSRLPLGAAVVIALCSACSSHSNPVATNPPGATCSIGTQVQLANPLPGATGVATNIGQITIVVNANSDILAGNWNGILIDQFGNQIQGGTFTLTSDHGGPHPYPTDYYYNSSIPQLNVGTGYRMFLNQFTSQCNPLFVGSFST